MEDYCTKRLTTIAKSKGKRFDDYRVEQEFIISIDVSPLPSVSPLANNDEDEEDTSYYVVSPVISAVHAVVGAISSTISHTKEMVLEIVLEMT